VFVHKKKCYSIKVLRLINNLSKMLILTIFMKMFLWKKL